MPGNCAAGSDADRLIGNRLGDRSLWNVITDSPNAYGGDLPMPFYRWIRGTPAMAWAWFICTMVVRLHITIGIAEEFSVRAVKWTEALKRTGCVPKCPALFVITGPGSWI